MTRNYFENLVRALENGLADVDSNGAASSKATSSKNTAGSSKGRGGRGKGTLSFKNSISCRMSDDNIHWSCEHCTYANVKSATICQMCNQPRRWKFRFSLGNTCLLPKPTAPKSEMVLLLFVICWLHFLRLLNVSTGWNGHGTKERLPSLHSYSVQPNLMYLIALYIYVWGLCSRLV